MPEALRPQWPEWIALGAMGALLGIVILLPAPDRSPPRSASIRVVDLTPTQLSLLAPHRVYVPRDAVDGLRLCDILIPEKFSQPDADALLFSGVPGISVSITGAPPHGTRLELDVADAQLLLDHLEGGTSRVSTKTSDPVKPVVVEFELLSDGRVNMEVHRIEQFVRDWHYTAASIARHTLTITRQAIDSLEREETRCDDDSAGQFDHWQTYEAYFDDTRRRIAEMDLTRDKELDAAQEFRDSLLDLSEAQQAARLRTYHDQLKRRLPHNFGTWIFPTIVSAARQLVLNHIHQQGGRLEWTLTTLVGDQGPLSFYELKDVNRTGNDALVNWLLKHEEYGEAGPNPN